MGNSEWPSGAKPRRVGTVDGRSRLWPSWESTVCATRRGSVQQWRPARFLSAGRLSSHAETVGGAGDLELSWYSESS